MLENLIAQTLETILNNPISKNEINTVIGIEEDHNKKIIKQLKEINDSSINKLLNMRFSVIFYIYIFGNEELNYNNKNLSFLEEDLKDTGKYFNKYKNKELKKEEINKKRIMIKIFAIQFDLSELKSRNSISDI